MPIVDPADYFNPHVVKVTVDAAGDALYFSRAAIPAAGAPEAGPDMPPCNAHIGLYAFRREFLLRFAALPQTPLERIESLEQLRALEHGYRIRTVLTQHATVGVDTPEDLERAREHLDVLTVGICADESISRVRSRRLRPRAARASKHCTSEAELPSSLKRSFDSLQAHVRAHESRI